MRWFATVLYLLVVASPLHLAAQSSSDCLDCHSDPSLTKEIDGRTTSVHVDRDRFNTSVHAMFDCVDCHAGITGYPHDPVPKVDCAQCHPDAVGAFEAGVHAKAAERGVRNTAACASCHGAPHEMLASSEPKSKTNRVNLTETCGSCHGVRFVMEPSGFSVQPFFSYRESVHGRAVVEGSTTAAVCIDCHDSHDIRTARDPESPIFKFNVPETCGNCHESVAREFQQSVHGKAIERGRGQSPVCTDCHGIHMIKAHIDPTSSVSSQAVARTTCAQCHEGVRLTQEFGVAGRKVSSYRDSYHGLARRLGSDVAANCASCHGVHNILPSADPASTIHRENLAATCGACHPGAGENFTRGRVHLDIPAAEEIGSRIIRWIRSFYLTLIIGVIGAMLLHNGIIWWRKAAIARKAADRTIIRMNRNQRIQHFLLLASFFVLVITGFALAYPESWFALLLGSSETVRRIGHRVAAVVMLAVGVWHLGYMLFTREGRQGIRDFMFRMHDLRDLVTNMRHYARGSVPRPKFGRFSYGEKAEYWALVWGIVVMGVTGIMLWYKVGVSAFVPRWWVDIALAIHFYEAVLATLAIIVWHLYQVIFDPDVYPMNAAWIDGRMSRRLFEHEHPLAVEAEVPLEHELRDPDEQTDGKEGGQPPADRDDEE
ncbi:MAG TPA: cytochrome b/b6 domain-containing protein [Thermoanaerobaculia bacterium]|nr:cytochrome b/b6 domain-containing protein [Thermoanaerobaculia bacterium]